MVMTTQDKTAAEQRLQAGIEAYNDGKMDSAAEAFSDAEIRFRLLGDYKRAGDSRSMLADVQRQNNMLEQAIGSYRRAIKLYQEANHPLSEANTTLALGQVGRQTVHLDHTQE